MLPNTMSRCDYLDLIELVEGRREACRISMRQDRLGELCDFLNTFGPDLEIGFAPSPYQVADIYGGWDGKSERFRHDDDDEVYIARDVMVVRSIMAAELEHDYEWAGKLYGYPECCRTAFKTALIGGCDDWFNNSEKYPYLSRALDKSKEGDHFRMIMTPEMDNRLLSLFPCSFACGYAIEQAEWRLEKARNVDWEPQPTAFAGRIFDVA